MQSVKNELSLESILAVIKGVLPSERQSFALHEPFFNGNEWNYVKECLDTGWVSTAGKFVERFEEALVDTTGVKYAFAMANGTAALHMALKFAGVRPGDEVLVPDLTFVATANAVAYCGGIPHFVDSEEKTLGLDPLKLSCHLKKTSELKSGACHNKQTGRRVHAVIAMHTFGHPVDLEPLKKVCDDFKLVLIEDAAEALGSLYQNRHVGHWGALSVLSFNGNKICTTGGGGALLTHDEALGKRIRHTATTAKVAHPWAFTHDEIGYNYRMPNLNAALGLAQLEELPGFLKRKRALAERYRKAFHSHAGVKFFTEPSFSKSNYWLNTLLLDEEFKDSRDALITLLNEASIKARPAWTLMHKLPMFRECPRGDVSIAQNLEARLVNIPSSAFL
jgi:perosamine synthetase